MTDTQSQAAAFAQSMLAVAEDAGALQQASTPVTPEMKVHVEASLAKAIEAMLRQSEEAEPEAARAGARNDVITAQAFWWGWRLNVPHNQVEPLLNGSEIVSTIIELGLHVIPEIGEILGLVVKAYVAVMGAVIRGVDKGHGVYLNQTWLVEAAIIASGGILAGPALAVAFIPTTRKK